MRWMLLGLAVAWGGVAGCANTAAEPMSEFALSRMAPWVEVGPHDSLRLERVDADGTVVLRGVGDGRVYSARVGQMTPVGNGSIGVDVLSSDAAMQTAHVRTEKLTQTRVAAPW